jgi:hypothetical protein
MHQERTCAQLAVVRLQALDDPADAKLVVALQADKTKRPIKSPQQQQSQSTACHMLAVV